jgi:hypothetical protein
LNQQTTDLRRRPHATPAAALVKASFNAAVAALMLIAEIAVVTYDFPGEKHVLDLRSRAYVMRDLIPARTLDLDVGYDPDVQEPVV